VICASGSDVESPLPASKLALELAPAMTLSGRLLLYTV
jgi:hypothetical protein